jgi:hypothetical protein
MIFIDNKYSRWYFKLISFRKINFPSGIVENHHIVPRSLGGSDDIENLVKLTPREHFICHLLITKCCPDKLSTYKMVTAAHHMMHLRGNKTNRSYKITSRTYEMLKTKYIALHSERMKSLTAEQKSKFAKCRTGTIQSQEERDKRSASLKGRKITELHRQRISQANKGRRLSEETKEKMRNSWRMRPSMSEETKQKISKSHLGKTISLETKKKMSIAKLGKPVSEETKSKMAAAKIGTVQSDITKEKRSASLKKVYEDYELRAKIGLAVSAAKKGKPSSQRGAKRSEETKAKMALARKAYWERRLYPTQGTL